MSLCVHAGSGTSSRAAARRNALAPVHSISRSTSCTGRSRDRTVRISRIVADPVAAAASCGPPLPVADDARTAPSLGTVKQKIKSAIIIFEQKYLLCFLIE